MRSCPCLRRGDALRLGVEVILPSQKLGYTVSAISLARRVLNFGGNVPRTRRNEACTTGLVTDGVVGRLEHAVRGVAVDTRIDHESRRARGERRGTCHWARRDAARAQNRVRASLQRR